MLPTVLWLAQRVVGVTFSPPLKLTFFYTAGMCFRFSDRSFWVPCPTCPAPTPVVCQQTIHSFLFRFFPSFFFPSSFGDPHLVFVFLIVCVESIQSMEIVCLLIERVRTMVLSRQYTHRQTLALCLPIGRPASCRSGRARAMYLCLVFVRCGTRPPLQRKVTESTVPSPECEEKNKGTDVCMSRG